MILIGASLFQTNSLLAKTDFNIYSLPDGIDDVSFTLYSDQINDVLKSKKILAPGQQVSAKAFWYKGKHLIELEGAKKLKREVKTMIIEAFEQKASLVWGSDFKKWTEGYSEERASDGQLIYKDPTGILEKSEITINHSRDKILVNEKKPIGTVRTEIELSYPKWSKSKAVIEKTTRIAYEGSRVIRSNTQVVFKKYKKKFYLPVKILVQSTQSVTFEAQASLDRKVNEEYSISDYQINKGIAKSKL